MSLFVGEIYLATIIYALLILFVFLVLKNFVVKIIIKFVKKVTEKYKFKSISLMVGSLERPLRSFFTYTGIYCALSILPINSSFSLFIYRVFRTCIIITITQCLLNIVTAYSVVLNNVIEQKDGKPLISKTLFPLLSKVIKGFIILLAIVVVASEFDFKQLNSILAGVGIGGAAIALASQDLIKNFFGGFIVLTDRSFNVGDYINVDSNEGTVEELGLRSTKIRTLGQELIVVPNSKFTDGAVINYTKRNLRRVSFKVGVTYNTSSEKLKSIIEKIKNMLDSHSMIKVDSALVKFDNFSPNSLEILIQYMINTGEYGEYMSIKDEINFKIMDLFEEEELSFAFPSMSVYMEKSIKENYES